MVGYLRVSTEEQGESGAGLDAQEAAIRADVKRRGWTLVDIYTDVASGKSRARRPDLKAALDRIGRGEAGTLMVAKLDRLSRSLVDFAAIMAEAQARGWNLVALDLGVDLSTPAGEFLASVMASMAQWERRIIGQRTSEALRALQASGVQLGRPSTVTDETVAYIVRLRADGDSYWSIAKRLNQNGTPTGQGGTKWHASTVRAIHMRRTDDHAR